MLELVSVSVILFRSPDNPRTTMPARIPRYVRVNTLKSTCEEVENALQLLGYQLGNVVETK